MKERESSRKSHVSCMWPKVDVGAGSLRWESWKRTGLSGRIARADSLKASDLHKREAKLTVGYIELGSGG